MTASPVCRRCGEPLPDGVEPDAHGWCAACFRAVVRRSTWAAVPAGLLVAAAYFWLLDRFGLFQSRFVTVFLALGVVLGWLAFKVVRRVAFEVVQARARRRG
jgi:F0F1-type ATP synthase assembly protein I